MSAIALRKPLEYYLGLRYPFTALVDPDGWYVALFPDLPGCVTQAETLERLAAMAEEARTGWITTEYEEGRDIPEPCGHEYSGKFNVRMPKSLHRTLADTASREGVSLNQYVVTLLSRGDAQAQVERQLRMLTSSADALEPSPARPYSHRRVADKSLVLRE